MPIYKSWLSYLDSNIYEIAAINIIFTPENLEKFVYEINRIIKDIPSYRSRWDSTYNIYIYTQVKVYRYEYYIDI